MNKSTKNILIIGASNVGKTHFGGQLYGRLDEQKCSLKLREQPESLSVFKEVWEKLNNGLLGAHTTSNQNLKIVFPVEDSNGNVFNITYPDYAGEQVCQIVQQRRVNTKWIDLIKNSEYWILFIRPSLIDPVVDITSKLYEHIEQDKQKDDDQNEKLPIEIKDSSANFYLELLQMFLFIKGISKTNKNKPHLTVLLSCWDEIKSEIGNQTPKVYFQKKMPMLQNFITSVWKDNCKIYGLSSLGQSLSNNEPDIKFANEGPENKGYFINEQSTEKISDITLIFNKH